MYYVEHKGHKWAMMAVSFKTVEAAIAEARRSAKDAMRTTVYDCTNDQAGKVVWCTSRNDS